jgi:hypothetical protein
VHECGSSAVLHSCRLTEGASAPMQTKPPQKIYLIVTAINDDDISDQTDKNRYYT